MSQDSIFLSKDELKSFTGAVHRSLICSHLEMRGIPYDLNRNMDVIVLRDEVKNFLSGNGVPRGRSRKGKKLNF
ncbi:MAG: hypothetical protein CMK89_12845 [Pseudomonadales bacterium]|nr:hypothetical protein [Pseudomonadales bacterium]